MTVHTDHMQALSCLCSELSFWFWPIYPQIFTWIPKAIVSHSNCRTLGKFSGRGSWFWKVGHKCMIVWDALERNYIKTRFKMSETKKEAVFCTLQLYMALEISLHSTFCVLCGKICSRAWCPVLAECSVWSWLTELTHSQKTCIIIEKKQVIEKFQTRNKSVVDLC